MQAWALNDAQVLAKYFNLAMERNYPNESLLIAGQHLWQLSVKDIGSARAVFESVWQHKLEDRVQASTPVINYQIKNQKRLLNKGHYLPASLYFAGDWFVGVDRLFYLEDKLTTEGLNKEGLSNKYQIKQPKLPNSKAENFLPEHTLQIYLSLRSPYSYLGFVKARRLAHRYHLKLKIKPVVPLMMRGLKVPLSKQRYIYTDAFREAQAANIKFSTFNDPYGAGIINCYQLFAYIESQGKEEAFIDAAFQAIYVKNLNLAQASVVEALCHQIGIDYQLALAYQEEHDWQVWSDTNLQELSNDGFWGVPCFKFGEVNCWGQDRLFLIEDAILQKLNDNTKTSQ